MGRPAGVIDEEGLAVGRRAVGRVLNDDLVARAIADQVDVLVDGDGLDVRARLDQDGVAVVGRCDGLGDRGVGAGAVLGDHDGAVSGEESTSGDASAGDREGEQQRGDHDGRNPRHRRTDGHVG